MQGQCFHGEHTPPPPKHTLSEENTTAVVSRHPPLDHYRELKSGEVRRSSRSCRRRKGVTSICKRVSRLSRGWSDLTYVFHAPDISITISRLSVVAASVRCCLSGASNTFHWRNPEVMHVQYCLAFAQPFGNLSMPTVIIVSWSIRQACSLGVYPDGLFGYRLGSDKLGGAFPLTCRNCSSPFFNHNARGEQWLQVQR